jgi:hypothetical protein
MSDEQNATAAIHFTLCPNGPPKNPPVWFCGEVTGVATGVIILALSAGGGDSSA